MPVLQSVRNQLSASRSSFVSEIEVESFEQKMYSTVSDQWKYSNFEEKHNKCWEEEPFEKTLI